MKPRIAFALILSLFVGLGGLLFIVATSPVSGAMYWLAFAVLGYAVGKKGYASLSTDPDETHS